MVISESYAVMDITNNELVYGFDEFDENDKQVPWFALTAPPAHNKYLSFPTRRLATNFMEFNDLDSNYKVVKVKLAITIE